MYRSIALMSVFAACAGCAHGSSPSSPASPASLETAEAAAPAPDARASFEAAVDASGQVPPEAVQAWVTAPSGIRVLDVRDADELAGELGHIDGVEHVPLAELEQASAAWDKQTPVVVVCKSGKRSSAAAAQLKAQGFTHVGFMAGGMQRWNDEGRPVAR
jgi:rhodanese-related sulfurtransferase